MNKLRKKTSLVICIRRLDNKKKVSIKHIKFNKIQKFRGPPEEVLYKNPQL